MSPTQRSIASVVLAGVLFGTAGTAGALGPAGTTPLGAGAMRLIVGAVALALLLLARGVRPRRLVGMWGDPTIVIAAFGAAGYQLTFFPAVEGIGVGLATLLAVGSAPIFAGLIAWPVLHHRPSVSWAVATSVCIAGLGLRLSDQVVAQGELLAGTALALGAGLSMATWTVAAKRAADRGAGPTELPAATFALGALLVVPVLATQPLGWLTEPSGIALALYLGVATMAIANVLLTIGLRGLSPGPVTTLVLTDPVVATVLGVVVLGETLSPVAWLGVAVVLAGLVLQTVTLARARGAGGRTA